MNTRKRSIGIAGLCLALLVAGACGWIYRSLGADTPSAESLGGQGPFAPYTVVTDAGEALSLAQGEYLVAMLSMSCEHCMASVPRLNEMMEAMPEIPVVALCWEPSEGAMAEFVSMSGPLFPMHSLGDNFLEFAGLIGNAPPRLSFVRDGVAVQSWDDTMPDLETLLAAVAPSPDT